jgi:GrpB-like predicted nucleotidyltransferase (UPF0157 family)
MSRPVILVPHDPGWKQAFETESTLITQSLNEIVEAIHHVGSTAIPTIYAKPIIDILLEVDDISHLDERTSKMEALGYQAMGEYGIPGRRYFRKSDQRGTRIHHVHAFKVGSEGVRRHLAFRDYLIAHPIAAKAYEALNLDLARQFPEDKAAFQDGKDAFIKAVEQKALDWVSHQPRYLSSIAEV